MTTTAATHKSTVRNIQTLDIIDVIQHGKTTAEKERAFAELYAMYESPLKFHLTKMVNSVNSLAGDEKASIVEDLIQETFIKVFKSINTYVPKSGAFSTFLHSIAKNSFIDWTRHRAVNNPATAFTLIKRVLENNPESESKDFEDSIRDDSASSSSEMMNAEIRKVILLALNNSGCNRKEIDLFIMVVVQNMKYNEVVEEKGIKMGALKGTLFRAKEKLRTYIKTNYPDFAI